MTTIVIGQAYPLAGPELKTKPNLRGITYTFRVSSMTFLNHNIVVVRGQDKHEVWCKREYKVKQAPKWLKEGIRQCATPKSGIGAKARGGAKGATKKSGGSPTQLAGPTGSRKD